MGNIRRFMFNQADVRGEIVQLTTSFTEIISQHAYPAYLRKALGEALLVTVMMSNILKLEGQLTVQFQSDGPLKTIVAKCNHKNHIRGFIEWDDTASIKALQANFNSGELVITIAPHNHSPYQSIVPLENRSIPEALEHYFAQSEQLSTRFWCAVDDSQAAGMMLQLMPNYKAKNHTTQRENFWSYATQLGQTITEKELLSLDSLQILHRLYHQEDLLVFEAQPVTFKCNCSIERMQNAVRLLGEAEARSILETNREIEVKCEYCSNRYAFDRDDLNSIFVTH